MIEYDFLDNARIAGERAGIDFAALFDFCFEKGLVYKTRDFLLLAEDDEENDRWIVHWLEVHPSFHLERPEWIATLMRAMPYWRSKVAWQRTLKNSRPLTTHSTARLMRIAHELTARQDFPPCAAGGADVLHQAEGDGGTAAPGPARPSESEGSLDFGANGRGGGDAEKGPSIDDPLWLPPGSNAWDIRKL